MKKLLLALIITVSALVSGDIKVAIASNVSFAMNELKEKFQKDNPNIKVHVIIGSSGKLAAQIINGAPFGIFMSANMSYPERLFKENIAISEPIVYAKGTIAMFSTKTRDYSSGLDLLKDDSIKKIAIANPKTAPYGNAAKEAMKSSKIYEDIKGKIVYAESISQTLSYATTSVDIAVVASSLLKSPRMKDFKEHKHWESIDSKGYKSIKQGMVLISGAGNEDRDFYDFILSDDAKAIFKKYGYKLSE